VNETFQRAKMGREPCVKWQGSTPHRNVQQASWVLKGDLDGRRNHLHETEVSDMWAEYGLEMVESA